MKKEQWEILLKCARMEEQDNVPVALIVDSPWIPGYTGINTLDFYSNPGIWWEAQQKIRADFPDVLFIPDYWVEFGMACEPSGFGCKLNFYTDRPLTIQHLVDSCDDIDDVAGLPVPNPLRDGLMPLVLNYYRRAAELAGSIGDDIRLVAARGPLNVATHMMGVTEFLLALKLYPESTHKLLRNVTALIKNWLEAQSDAVGGAQGIFLLDDIIGFLSPEDYQEFAHPYFKEIYDAFPLPVRILHNDTDNPVSYPYLASLGVNIFNFAHERKLSEVRELVGDRICLMGNIPPLHVLTEGAPAEVAVRVTQCLDDYGGKGGILLSAGGGASPGMPGENVAAMVDAAKLWSASH